MKNFSKHEKYFLNTRFVRGKLHEKNPKSLYPWDNFFFKLI